MNFLHHLWRFLSVNHDTEINLKNYYIISSIILKFTVKQTSFDQTISSGDVHLSSKFQIHMKILVTQMTSLS